MLELARENSPFGAERDESLNPSDDDSNAPKLEEAISDFLDRISGGNGNAQQLQVPKTETRKVEPKPEPAPAAKVEKKGGAAYQPRTAPETADVMEKMRSLAKLTADRAIERHALNRLMLRAKLWLWGACLAMLSVVGLLQIPYGVHPELTALTPFACLVAVCSTVCFSLTVRNLRRTLRTCRTESAIE